MHKQLFAATLFAATFVAVALLPGAPASDPVAAAGQPGSAGGAPRGAPAVRPQVDVVFALDTTGSMGGMIATAKEKIWSIAGSMARAQPTPLIRIGLVAYRDRGDAYVTRVIDLSDDLDSVYASLMELQADGGGDGPESVNQALRDAVTGISWTSSQGAYRTVFLVGDAPPHLDYPSDPPYSQTLADARQAGIVVNAIQCGGDEATAAHWRTIARLGQGSYFQVEQAGGGVAITTPYDATLADLSSQLDATRMYYGPPAVQERQQLKTAATGKLHATASVSARARRAAFNATASGQRNLLGDGELIDDLASGRVQLDAIDERHLPSPLRAAPAAEREQLVAEQARRRDELVQEIDMLTERRAAYIEEQLAAAGGAGESLDQRIYDAVRDQAADSGLEYEAAAPSY